MIVFPSKSIYMTSVWDGLISQYSKKLVDQYSETGSVNALDVEKLNKLKEKRDEASRSK